MVQHSRHGREENLGEEAHTEAGADTIAEADGLGEDEAPQKLNLAIDVQKPSACERHITVTVPREDIDRYFDKAFSDMMESAAIPGFRPGRAPRKLVEHRYRKDVADQVRGSLLLDSMTQITESEDFVAISEPNFDPTAVELPDDGPLKFEFDIEVRPEFDLPNWKGLNIERPVRDFSEADVDQRLEVLLTNRGQLVPYSGAAEPGDYIVCKLAFKNGDQTLVEGTEEETLRLRPSLSFRDGNIEKFDKQMKGVRAGETRELNAKLTDNAPNEALRGKTVTAIFNVLEVKKLKLPELNDEFARSCDFEDVADLRKGVRGYLESQLAYQQQQAARKQVTAALTASANWDLPPDLLRRQSRRELERAVLELQRNGFGEAEIRAHENEIRQNSAVSTARALKEHFILERIAEEEKIDADADDYDHEIALIARQEGQSPRRVRARLDKAGMMDALRNQIIERKVLDMVLEHAKFKDVPYKPAGSDTEAVDSAAGGEEEESDIPEAKHPGEPEATPGKPKH
ncbi:MAG TPA: trigger factor [Pirellulales bacterium]|jgi:trigger factor|nr:trigger factor [Pirellulales bacterium]